MTRVFESMFAEQIDSAMHFAHWIAGIAVALCAIYTALVTAGFFVPKMRSLLALYNKIFALVVVVLIGGGAAFLFYATPKTRVVHVPTPVFDVPDIIFPDIEVDFELPDVPLDEIADSASEVIDAVAEASIDLVTEVGASLMPEMPTVKDLDAFQEKQRKAQYQRMVQHELDMAHQRLRQAAGGFGGGYSSPFGTQAWATNFSHQSRGRSRSANLERQSKAAVDGIVSQFETIEADLLLAVRRAANQTSHDAYMLELDGNFRQSIKGRVNDCYDRAERLANGRRSGLRRIDKQNIHNQIGQWRSEFMREELGPLVDELREEWARHLSSRCDVELR